MVWTDTTRARYGLKSGHYASDFTDEEWGLIEVYLPQAKRIVRPRTTDLRDFWDAIQYMACTGCQCSMIPNDFPPPSTVQRYFYVWFDSGLLNHINHSLVMIAREFEGHEAQPTVGVIDSQTFKTIESVSICDYDASPRHIFADAVMLDYKLKSL